MNWFSWDRWVYRWWTIKGRVQWWRMGKAGRARYRAEMKQIEDVWTKSLASPSGTMGKAT